MIVNQIYSILWWYIYVNKEKQFELWNAKASLLTMTKFYLK